MDRRQIPKKDVQEFKPLKKVNATFVWRYYITKGSKDPPTIKFVRLRVKLLNIKWADRWNPFKPIKIAHGWYYAEYAADWRQSSVATR